MLTPFFDYPPELRKVMYTTSAGAIIMFEGRIPVFR